MTFKFSRRSREVLNGVHPDLRAVMERAIGRSPVDFAAFEGKRTMERQRQLYRDGKSKTMNSRHLTGHAVDMVPWLDGALKWDWPALRQMAPVIKEAAADLGVPIEWGGDWGWDGAHWQLPWAEYAADDMRPRAKGVGVQDNKAEAIALLKRAIELLEA